MGRVHFWAVARSRLAFVPVSMAFASLKDTKILPSVSQESISSARQRQQLLGLVGCPSQETMYSRKALAACLPVRIELCGFHKVAGTLLLPPDHVKGHGHFQPQPPPFCPLQVLGSWTSMDFKTALVQERHTQTVSPGDLVPLWSRQEVLFPSHPATHGHLLSSLETPLWSP